MAFVIEQPLADAQHYYDREGDVLYVSFGPLTSAVSLTVEDWFITRMSPTTHKICGITIVGFKRLFSKMRPDLVKELSARVDRLRKAYFLARYVDETDTLPVSFEEDQPAIMSQSTECEMLKKAVQRGHG